MFDPRPLMVLIPALPLLASVLIAFVGPRTLRERSHWPCIVAALLSCALSVWILVTVHRHGEDVEMYYQWFAAGNLTVGFTLRADALSAIMLVTVTFISSLIAIYSAGYMHGDEGYPRFFAEISLFIFSMTGLVLANNFLVLYAFWEGVGLCSYLLIGFWFTKPSAAAAARKAFLVTRLGDIGLLIGILLLWSQFRLAGLPLYSINFGSVFGAVNSEGFEGPLTLVCLLLFCGAVGKSAQFPLHVWLPDAMEGPTPVSALIHAATMVTAGVYLVARCTPLFEHAPDAQLVVACIGGFTALLTALIALTQNDLKRVLAYSTISQLGYMFLALGSASHLLLPIGMPDRWFGAPAVVAAVFHLFTHAFFKALLFLAAGSVMHAMGNVIDMRRFGGLRKMLPVTHATFLCGALALAGCPPFAGFWSKDEIFGAALEASEQGQPHATIYYLLFISALVTAGLTAFYTFRAYFLTFWGDERIPHEAGGHAHESPRVMTVPLVILAAGAVLAGFVNAEPLTGWFAEFLQPLWQHETKELHNGANFVLMLGSTAVALSGIGIAAWMYLLQPALPARFAGNFQVWYQLSLNKFYLDELYDFFLVRPVVGFAKFCRGFDFHVIDQSLVDQIGQIPRYVGGAFRGIQNGLAQFYALAMAGAVAVIVAGLVWQFGIAVAFGAAVLVIGLAWKLD
jgi:NADH-quinone oxidoreductase subunit L